MLIFIDLIYYCLLFLNIGLNQMSECTAKKNLRKQVTMSEELWRKLGQAKCRTYYPVSELIAKAVDSFDFNCIRDYKDRSRKRV